MGARTRKAIGSVIVVAFVTAWIWAMASLSMFVPRHWAAEMVFYAVAGLFWGVPLLPLIRWMQAKD